MTKVLDQKHGANFSIYNADCVPFVRDLPKASIDFSVYSPPFSELFVYSDSVADMGNVKDDAEFQVQYKFLLKGLFDATRPGRLSAVHVSDVPATMTKDGYIGIRDFSGGVIQSHLETGWHLHSKVTIWKCPVLERARTQAHGLLHKTIKKDSSRVRVGMPDYLLIFRRPVLDGEDHLVKPIQRKGDEFPVSVWQEWASPVWTTINQTNVLRPQKSEKDEKHLCPLQLDVIERAVNLWADRNDTVFSPFMGIGSEGYGAVKYGRRFMGTELKPEYFSQACINIEQGEIDGVLQDLPFIEAQSKGLAGVSI